MIRTLIILAVLCAAALISNAKRNAEAQRECVEYHSPDYCFHLLNR